MRCAGPPFLESPGAERKMAERRGGCLFALKANNKRRRPWPRSTGMRWISSSSRTQHDAYSLHDPLRDGRNHVHPGRNRDAKAFEVYVEHFLAPSLSEGQVVVLDKLGAHRPGRIRELIEDRGAQLIYLPSYCPDLNPIEICQPQCAFEHKPSYHRPPRAARATGVGREARSRPYIRRRGGAAMLSRGAVPPVHSRQRAPSSLEGASPGQSQAASDEPQPPAGTPLRGTRYAAAEGDEGS